MKRKLRNLLWLVSIAAMLFMLDHRTTGYSVFQVSGQVVVWAGGQSVRCLSPTTFPPGSDMETLIFEAMALWNIVPAADFEYFYSPLAQDFPIDHFDGFNDTAAVPASQLDPGVLGVTFMVNNGAEWFDTDILFSDLPAGVGYTLDPNPPCDVVAQPVPSNGFSFLLIAVHELGHGLGLGHEPIGDEPVGTPWFPATMNPRYPGGGPIGQQNIVEVHTDDRDGLRFLYPPSGLAAPPVVDLANSGYGTGDTLGQVVPLAVDPTVVWPGGTVTVQSFIENFGTTSEFSVRQGFYLSTDPVIDRSDPFLGSLLWDIAFQDALQFGVSIDMPVDLPAGSYYLGSILDDLDQVTEAFEDNNTVVYCNPVTVLQLPPAINPFPQQIVPCGQPYSGPSPTVTHPLNMNPITWSLENAPAGMTINPTTGVVSWPSPIHSSFLYTITVRAANSAGSSTQTLFLGVEADPPQLRNMPDGQASCQPVYVGPTPQLLVPACMEPILTWSLDTAPPGMTIDPGTGRVTWTKPLPSPLPYLVTIRATNVVGSGSTSWLVHVNGGDFNGDAGQNLLDFRLLLPCLRGPGQAMHDGCSCADGDLDGDVDLLDFSRFQNGFSGGL